MKIFTKLEADATIRCLVTVFLLLLHDVVTLTFVLLTLFSGGSFPTKIEDHTAVRS